MRTLSMVNNKMQGPPKDRANERGAALVTVLLLSVLVLAAGGTLIMTTGLSATNSVDATAETQAYYAAEAGLQATLAVFRGNIAPNPLFDPSSASAPGNKITFRKAVTPLSSNRPGDGASASIYNIARLSRWLNYDSVNYPSPVEISSPYSSMSGMAYTAVVDDPDNTISQTFSTLGSFGTDTPSSSTVSYEFRTNGSNRVTVTYVPQSSSAITASGTTLGTFSLSNMIGSPPFSTDPRSTFVITIRQVSSTGTTDVPVKCTLAQSGPNTVSITFQTPSSTSNNISGTTYIHASSATVSSSGSVSIPVTITPPEPSRVRVIVTGYGPRGAKKQMHMLLSRFAFDFTPSAAITLRGADSATAGTIAIGNSSQYTYTGYDNAGGSNLPGLLVTDALDYTTGSTEVTLGGTQVTGNPAMQQTSPATLSSFLQTADQARALVDALRLEAQTEGRYFTTATPPTDFGATSPNGLFTFVDGDVDLPPGGGAGLLVVTGTLTMRGSADFQGLILVLGGGRLIRDGGGNGTTLGSIVVASFGATGGFLPPTFVSNGTGTADVKYDSNLSQKGLQSAGPRTLAVSEY